MDLRDPLGICLLLLGVVHFTRRDDTPVSRSMFIGTARSSPGRRAAWAVVELVLGAAFLLAR